MRAPKLKSCWLVLFGAFACSCSAEPAPAPRSPLTLQVKTNALITKDLDEAWVTIKQDGAEVYHWELELDPLLGAETLPVEVEVVPGNAKAPYIELLVEARRNGETVGQWRRGLLLPSDSTTVLDAQLQNERNARALAEGRDPQGTTAEAESYDAPVEPPRARLDIEIDGLCLDPRVTCPDSQTCVRGRCVDSEVEFEELPLLRESELIPPPQSVTAQCLDVEQCFADSEELVPLDEPCTFVTPSGGRELSLAAQLNDSRVGYCDSGVCLLPLQPGQDQDWTESDGVITLAPELCELDLVGHVLATHSCGITTSTSFCSSHVTTSGAGGAGGAGGGASPDAAGQAGTGGDDAPSGPIVLASGRSAPWTIAVNARGIFWVEPGQVMRVDLDGGTPSELANGSFVRQPSSLTLGDSTLYYSNSAGGTSGTVMSVPLEGNADPTPFAPAQGGQPWGVMASGGFVYWTALIGPSILRALEGSDGMAEIFHNASDSPRFYECVADSQNLYWGDAMGSIFKQGLTDTESTWLRDPMQLATAPVVRLAVAGGSVFWTTGKPSLPTSPTPGMSALYKVPIAGGDVTELASGDSVTAAVAADETGVYYCDGALKRLPHDGSSAQVIAEDQQAAAIALDQGYVYWTDATAGTVMRAPK